MAEVTLENVPQKTRDLFNKGFAAFERGNLDYAVDLLSSCVEMEPDCLSARKFLRAAEIRRFKQAKKGEGAHWLSMLTALPLYLKVSGLVKANKTAEALPAAEKLLRVDPLNLKFVRLFIQAAAVSGRAEAAVQTLEMVRDHYPDNVLVIHWLGSFYLKVGRTRSARECFEKLSEMNPNDPDALKALKDAMAIDSMSSDGWSDVAQKGGTYREIIKDKKEAELLEQKAKAVRTDRDADDLIADAVAKIEAEPGNVNYHRALARLYAQKGLFEDALATLAHAMEISPGDPEVDAAISAVRVQKFDAEIQQLQSAGDEQGAQDKVHERRQFLADDLQARVARYPNDLNLKFQWGILLYENDYINEAIQQFQAAQKNPKNRVQALYHLALCFKQKKQYDMAMDQLKSAAEQVVTMDESKKAICYELGDISERVGDLEKAKDYYKRVYQVDIGYKDVAEKIERLYGSSSVS